MSVLAEALDFPVGSQFICQAVWLFLQKYTQDVLKSVTYYSDITVIHVEIWNGKSSKCVSLCVPAQLINLPELSWRLISELPWHLKVPQRSALTRRQQNSIAEWKPNCREIIQGFSLCSPVFHCELGTPTEWGMNRTVKRAESRRLTSTLELLHPEMVNKGSVFLKTKSILKAYKRGGHRS